MQSSVAPMTALHPDWVAARRDRAELQEVLAKLSLCPGWNKPEPSLWSSPKRNFLPAHWRADLARAALSASTHFIGSADAERRNLILVNPVSGNTYATVRTLVAAYQLAKSGEVARSHRHTPNALRLVLNADRDVYTIVDGRRIPMQSGDIITTPAWSWHGHVNAGQGDALWIDFLDVPLVHYLEPMFFEALPVGEVETADIVDESSSLRCRWTDCLAHLEAAEEIAPGLKLLELPQLSMPTIELRIWHLRAGAETTPTPLTSNSILAVIEGSGAYRSEMLDANWRRGDVLAKPAGASWWLCASSESFFLEVTDQPLLRHLGWLRTIVQDRQHRGTK